MCSGTWRIERTLDVHLRTSYFSNMDALKLQSIANHSIRIGRLKERRATIEVESERLRDQLTGLDVQIQQSERQMQMESAELIQASPPPPPDPTPPEPPPKEPKKGGNKKRR